MPNSPCPNDQELLAFAQSTTQPADTLRIRNHLEQCPACRTVVHAQTTVAQTIDQSPLVDIGDVTMDLERDQRQSQPAGVDGEGAVAASDMDTTNAPSPLDETWSKTPSDPAETASRGDSPAATPARSDGGTSSSTGSQQWFGDYELVREIARGGMGVVYLARQSKANRLVALKMILAGNLASEDDVKRFYREAEAAANLQHPNIVPVYDVGEAEGRHFFSMAFVEGVSLADRIHEGPLDVETATSTMLAVTEGIAYAHERGVVHRDLKPANILIDANETPQITDFGLAKQREDTSGLTHSGQIMGTPSYMPPEQAMGNMESAGPAADVYSLGATLYHLLTGRPPFHAANVMDTLKQVLEQEPLTPSQLNPVIDRNIETICLKCLQKEPSKRYGTAAELADDLRHWLKGEPIVARPVTRWQRGWMWCKRNPLVATLSGIAATSLIAGAIVSGIAYWQTSLALAEEERQRVVAVEASKKFQRQEQIAQAARINEKAARVRAEERERIPRRNLFGAHMLLANQAIGDRDLKTAEELLNRYIPGADPLEDTSEQEDLRAFDWWYLWRLCHGEEFSLYGHVEKPTALAYSGDGESLISGGGHGRVCFWEPGTGELKHAEMAHADEVLAVELLRQDQQTLTVSSDGQAHVWNVPQRTVVRSLQLLPSKFMPTDLADIAISSRSWLIAAASDGSLYVHDYEQDKRLHELEIPCEELQSISMSDDDKYVSVAIVRREGEQLRQLALTFHTAALNPKNEKPLKELSEIELSKGSTSGSLTKLHRFEINNKGELSVNLDAWNCQTGERIQSLDLENMKCLAYNRDQTKVAFVEKSLISKPSPQLRVAWQPKVGDTVQRILRGHQGDVSCLDFSPSEDKLATASEDGSIRIWDLHAETRQELRPHSSKNLISPLAFEPTDKILISEADTGQIGMWRISSGELGGSVPLHAQGIRAMALSPERLLATGTHWDAEVRITNLASPEKIQTISDLQGPVKSLEFASTEGGDGDDGMRPGLLYIAAGDIVSQYKPTATADVMNVQGNLDAPGFMNVWDYRQEKMVHSFQVHVGGVNDADLSPNGKLLATCGGDGVAIWEVGTWKQLPITEGDEWQCLGVAFSPDNRLLAVCDAKDVISIINLETNQRTRIKSSVKDSLLGVIEFTNDGKALLAATQTGDLRFYDTITWEQRLTLQSELKEMPSAMQFNHAGDVLAGSTLFGQLVLWRAASAENVLAHQAHRLVYGAEEEFKLRGRVADHLQAMKLTPPAQEAVRCYLKTAPARAEMLYLECSDLADDPTATEPQIAAAAAMALEAWETAPDNHQYRNTYALFLLRAKQFDKVISLLKDRVSTKAELIADAEANDGRIAVTTNDRLNRLCLAVAHWRSGDQQQARNIWVNLPGANTPENSWVTREASQIDFAAK